jgi:tRNA (guanine37-N1)-methyltransferase
MQVDIITVLPGLLEGPFSHSILKRAGEKGLLQVNLINLRDYTPYPRAQVDDYQFGGGAGMVLMAEPLINAIESLKSKLDYDEIIYLTPDGETLDQKMNAVLKLNKTALPAFGKIKGLNDENGRFFFIRK